MLTGKFKALTGASSVTDKNGFFRSPKDFLKLVFNNEINEVDIYNEINEQLDLYASYYKSFPCHIDSHHYIHQIPIVSNVIIRIIKEREDAWSSIVRTCKTNLLKSILISKTDIFKIIFLHILGKKLSKRLKDNNIKTNVNFYGIYPFKKSNDYKMYLHKFKEAAANGDVIVTHPAKFIDKSLTSLDSLLEERIDEFMAHSTEQ